MPTSDPATPETPTLTYLYTLHASVHHALYTAAVPSGSRRVFPIKGGTFSGPRLNGEVLDLGADWVKPPFHPLRAMFETRRLTNG